VAFAKNVSGERRVSARHSSLSCDTRRSCCENSVGHGAVDLNNLDDWYEFHQAVLMTDAPKPSTDAETPASTADAATASAPASAPVATPAPAAEEQEPAPVGVS